MADAYEVFSIAVERVQHLSGEILGYLILGTYPIFGYFPLLRWKCGYNRIFASLLTVCGTGGRCETYSMILPARWCYIWEILVYGFALYESFCTMK
jgi:hypothetical protein